VSLQQLQTTCDVLQKIIEIVCQSARELAHRLHLLRLAKLLLGHGALGYFFHNALLERFVQLAQRRFGDYLSRDVSVGAEPAGYPSLCVRLVRSVYNGAAPGTARLPQ